MPLRSKSKEPEPEVQPPPGFQPLSGRAKAEILKSVALQWHARVPGNPPIQMLFTPSGKRWLADLDAGPGHVVEVVLPEAPLGERRHPAPPLPDDHHGDWRVSIPEPPAEVAKQLEGWFTDGSGRVWRPGQPVPEPEEVDESEWTPLSKRVVRQIRAQHSPLLQPPGSVGSIVGATVLYDPRSGECRGLVGAFSAGLSELAGLAEGMVRISQSISAEDVDLEAVKVSPVSGKVSEPGAIACGAGSAAPGHLHRAHVLADVAHLGLSGGCPPEGERMGESDRRARAFRSVAGWCSMSDERIIGVARMMKPAPPDYMGGPPETDEESPDPDHANVRIVGKRTADRES